MKISTTNHLHGILQLITRFPPYAILIRELWLAQPSHTLILTQCNKDMATTSASKTEEDGRHTTMNVAQLSDEAEKSSLLRNLNFCIEKGHLWAKSLFLLHQLPRLESLHFVFSVAECEIFLSKMIHHNLISPRLRVVKRWAESETAEAELLVAAFLYPSVTEICGYRVASSELELECDVLLPAGTSLTTWYGRSNVETIEFHWSSIGGEAMAELLQLPQCLKMLIYSEARVEDERVKLNFKEAREALEATCSSLENLSVRWRETGGFIENDYTWTLHDFRSLKNLFISYRLIFGPQPSQAMITSGVFPPTLEVLGMFPSQPSEDEWEDPDYVKAFEILLLGKDSANLPRLRLIAHLDKLALLETLVDLAASRGVQVALQKVVLELLPI
jgi:hypothetical protein